MGSMILGNLDKSSTTTCVLFGLYITMKSYSINNSNHLAIIPKTCDFLPNKLKPYDIHKTKIYSQQIMYELM
jgi:hypothetical protein